MIMGVGRRENGGTGIRTEGGGKGHKRLWGGRPEKKKKLEWWACQTFTTSAEFALD